MKKIILIFLISLIGFNAQTDEVIVINAGVVTPFVFTILTENEDDTFTLPIYDGGTYNFTVDWGDLSTSTITTYDDADNPHTYEDAGASTYTITITGTLNGWRFDGLGDCDLMKEITQWGCFRPGNQGDIFQGCENMTISATDIINLTDVTDLNEFFQGCDELTTVPSMNSWDISQITSLYGMMHSCEKFCQDISAWDTGNVTNYGYIFYNNLAFNQDISGWDTKNGTLMNWTFYDASAFNQNIGLWNTPKVTNMDFMLRGAVAFDQDLSGLNITSLTTADGMLLGVTLSTANYSALLIGWEAQVEKTGVDFGAGSSKYSAGAAATARGVLVNTSTWNITDGGQEVE